jgi:hypothetical protein
VQRDLVRDPKDPVELAPAAPQAWPAPENDLGATPAEQASGGAGMLLLLGPLIRMGLPGWLHQRPDLAGAGFASHLLRHIALRQRIPATDPLFQMLRAPHPVPFETMLDAWRVGLDRWLRRRARVRTAELARRRGWLLLAGDTLQARFPVDAADLRLRRLALDSDPGWLPWLGLCVRLHFRAEPLA